MELGKKKTQYINYKKNAILCYPIIDMNIYVIISKVHQ